MKNEKEVLLKIKKNSLLLILVSIFIAYTIFLFLINPYTTMLIYVSSVIIGAFIIYGINLKIKELEKNNNDKKEIIKDTR